jgi:hypothetical protein
MELDLLAPVSHPLSHGTCLCGIPTPQNALRIKKKLSKLGEMIFYIRKIREII